MFPLNDTEPNRYSKLSAMTVTLILVNVTVAFAEILFLLDDPFFFRLYGAVPHQVWTKQGGGALSAVTALFLHGGWLHLIGNMWGLWVFGCRVEDACGPWRFLQ